MEVLKTTIGQMAVLFFFIAVGFILKRKKVFPENTTTVLSKLENYVLIPALTINTFMNQCTVENLRAKASYIGYSTAILGATFLLSYFLSKKFSNDAYMRRMYRYSFVITNSGFFGNALVLGVFGQEALFNFMMFSIPYSIFSNSIGVSWLIPDGAEQGKKKSFFKSLINPPCIALAIGIILGITGIKLPAFAATALSGAAACMSPIAMIFTGFVLGGFKVTSLFKNSKVQITAFLRVVAIPLLFLIPMKLLGVPSDIIMMTLCYLALPLGLYTIVVPSAYGADTTLGASLTLVSHVDALVSIPLMFAIFL